MRDYVNDQEDVPYGEDWQNVAETTAWADTSDKKRPWRMQIRDYFAEQVAGLRDAARVLELGSGPGFLAERVLEGCPQLESYTLFDFSVPMIATSRERLARFPTAAFVLGSFKADDWVELVRAPFDAILSMQAVHEIRHKRYVPQLYRQLHELIAPSGLALICDHVPWDDTLWSTTLFMTEHEQTAALSDAGFVDVEIALSIKRLVVYRGRKAELSQQRA